MAKVEKQWSWNEDQPDTDYREVDSVDWEEEPYEFNMTRVYQQISTGDLFYATDMGCSCPSPFEDTEESDLTPIKRMQDWYDHVNESVVEVDPEEGYQFPRPTPTSAIDGAHRLGREINTLLKANKGQGRR